MERVTQAEYARRVGVSKVAIHKQVKAGIIPLHDGKIDPVEADRCRARHCDSVRLRGRPAADAKSAPAKPAKPKAKPPAEKPAPRKTAKPAKKKPAPKDPPVQPAETIKPPAPEPEPPPEQPAEPDRPSEDPEFDDLRTLTDAPPNLSRADEMARGEWLKNKKRLLDLAEAEGQLIDRAATKKAVFALARQLREYWQNWPARVAPIMAAELGIEPKDMQRVLDRMVREHLAEMSDPQLRLK